MLKLLVVIFAAVMATTFAMDNMHRVELGLIVGRPVHVRLFFLLLTSFLIGCFAVMLLTLYRNTRRTPKKVTAPQDEGDDFFSD